MIFFKGLLPGKTTLLKLADIWPALSQALKFKDKNKRRDEVSFAAKPATDDAPDDRHTEALAALAASLGHLPLDRLSRLSEAWFDVTVRTTLPTPWVPAGHLVSRQALSDPQLTEAIHQALPVPPELRAGRQVHLAVVTAAFVNVPDHPSAATGNGNGGSSSQGAKRMKNDGAGGAGGTAFTSLEVPSDGSEPHLLVTWSHGGHATVGYYCGRLTRWVGADGQPLLAAPVDTCFWRANTDNDRGGAGFSYTARWEAAGLGRMHREGQGEGESARPAYESHESCFDGSLVVKTRWTLLPPKNAVVRANILCQVRTPLTPRV